ncbi:MAG TPA: hypothetical protein VFB82_12805 [Blastocatellia bacterium]|nr:hypothetical protein [Blastocatellia bacterium]
MAAFSPGRVREPWEGEPQAARARVAGDSVWGIYLLTCRPLRGLESLRAFLPRARGLALG